MYDYIEEQQLQSTCKHDLGEGLILVNFKNDNDRYMMLLLMMIGMMMIIILMVVYSSML